MFWFDFLIAYFLFMSLSKTRLNLKEAAVKLRRPESRHLHQSWHQTNTKDACKICDWLSNLGSNVLSVKEVWLLFHFLNCAEVRMNKRVLCVENTAGIKILNFEPRDEAESCWNASSSHFKQPLQFWDKTAQQNYHKLSYAWSNSLTITNYHNEFEQTQSK